MHRLYRINIGDDEHGSKISIRVVVRLNFLLAYNVHKPINETSIKRYVLFMHYGLTIKVLSLIEPFTTGSIWILVHFIGQIIPFLFYAYYAIYSLDNFIPIQGRSGPTTNPEILIAIITGSTGVLMVGQLIQTLCIFRRPVIWMCAFLFVFFVFVVLMATPIGFPYREVLSQQRFWIFVSKNILRSQNCYSKCSCNSIQHTERQFYNFDRTVRRDNSGYFMLPMDRHSNHFVQNLIPEFASHVSTADECESEMFCGSPLYMSRMIEQSYVFDHVVATHFL